MFLADLTVLPTSTYVWAKMSWLISLRISYTSVKKSFSQLTWPFYGLLELYEQKYPKNYISASSMLNYYKSCS